MEYLGIEIYNHFSKVYTYLVWNGDMLVGEIAEDDVMKVLNKEQVIDFYHRDNHKTKVPKESVLTYAKKLQAND